MVFLWWSVYGEWCLYGRVCMVNGGKCQVNVVLMVDLYGEWCLNGRVHMGNAVLMVEFIW